MRYEAGDLIEVYQGSRPPLLATVQALKGFHYVLHYHGNLAHRQGSFTSNGYYVDVESNSILILSKTHSSVKRNRFKDSPYS